MSEPIDIENDKNIIEKFDEFLDEYQKHSGKISIGLSILGGISAILVGKFIIVGSIAIGITNASLFFSGLMIEKIVNKKNIIANENKTLKNELSRRITLMDNFKFPKTPSEITNITPKSNVSTNTHYEEVIEIKF